MMPDKTLYKNEIKNFKNDLIENLIDWHIDLTDFNVIKPFIVENIETKWKGDIEDLKKYLAEQNECTVYEIQSLLEKTSSKNWPEFFKDKRSRDADDFQVINNLTLGRVVFLDNEKEERRRHTKEFKLCMMHHCKRSFECNNIGMF